jgi:hypothetical protein
MVWKWWSNNLTVLLVYLAPWAEDSQAISKGIYPWALTFQQVFWEATEWVLPEFGFAFAFVIKSSQTQNHHHFHHLSWLLIVFEEFRHLFSRGVKISSFAMVLSSFIGFCNGFALDFLAFLILHQLCNEISAWKPVGVTHCRYACFHAYFHILANFFGHICSIVDYLHWSIIIRLIHIWVWIVWVFIGHSMPCFDLIVRFFNFVTEKIAKFRQRIGKRSSCTWNL